MKLPDVIFLSLAVTFIIIGVHQTITVGFGNAYWALMLALAFFFIFSLRKRRS
jgi:predicted membrane protein